MKGKESINKNKQIKAKNPVYSSNQIIIKYKIFH